MRPWATGACATASCGVAGVGGADEDFPFCATKRRFDGLHLASCPACDPIISLISFSIVLPPRSAQFWYPPFCPKLPTGSRTDRRSARAEVSWPSWSSCLAVSGRILPFVTLLIPCTNDRSCLKLPNAPKPQDQRRGGNSHPLHGHPGLEPFNDMQSTH
jgi:hypothetical protein